MMVRVKMLLILQMLVNVQGSGGGPGGGGTGSGWVGGLCLTHLARLPFLRAGPSPMWAHQYI